MTRATCHCSTHHGKERAKALRGVRTMKRSPRLSVACVTALLGLAGCGGPNNVGSLEEETPGSTSYKLGSVNVLTRNYDNKRSGANLLETSLVPSKVTSTTFGKHFEMPVDDQIYAGVLYASGVTISASVSGNGDGGSTVNFNSHTQNQRSAVTLVGNNLYIGWSGHCDTPQYHGWVLAYDKTTLAQVAKFNTTPNGTQGGIWQSGGGPVVDDSSNVYYATGNGTSSGGPGYSNSVVKLQPGTLTVLSFFT